MKNISSVLLALSLAACQQPGNDGNIASDNRIATAETANVETEMRPPSEEGGVPATQPTTIPAQFHGRWSLVSADCTSTRGDAKGLLTITGTGLAFYESRGTIDEVLGGTATSFDARYGFTGEGQTWQRNERLSLVRGKLQRRTDAEPGQEPPVNLTYERCGA